MGTTLCRTAQILLSSTSPGGTRATEDVVSATLSTWIGAAMRTACIEMSPRKISGCHRAFRTMIGSRWILSGTVRSNLGATTAMKVRGFRLRNRTRLLVRCPALPMAAFRRHLMHLELHSPTFLLVGVSGILDLPLTTLWEWHRCTTMTHIWHPWCRHAARSPTRLA